MITEAVRWKCIANIADPSVVRDVDRTICSQIQEL